MGLLSKTRHPSVLSVKGSIYKGMHDRYLKTSNHYVDQDKIFKKSYHVPLPNLLHNCSKAHAPWIVMHLATIHIRYQPSGCNVTYI